jgi:hypothetical protein
LKFKSFTGKLIGCFLLFLFLGYYGSITLFTHSHIINGVTIVHSHPFNKDKGDGTTKMPHSEKQLLLIQLLSEFLSAAALVSLAVFVLRSLLYELPFIFTIDGYAKSADRCSYSLRGPPSKYEVIGLVKCLALV